MVGLEDWIVPYGIPDVVLTHNAKQFTSKFFAALCASLGAKLVTTMECNPQCNRQAERYNRTLVARLRHYIDEHQQVWDIFVQPLPTPSIPRYIGQQECSRLV